MIRNYAHNKKVKLVLVGLLCASIAQNSCCFFGVFEKIKSIFFKAPKQTTKSSFLKKGFMGITAAAMLLGACYTAYKFFTRNNQGDEQTGGEKADNDKKPNKSSSNDTTKTKDKKPKPRTDGKKTDNDKTPGKNPVEKKTNPKPDKNPVQKNLTRTIPYSHNFTCKISYFYNLFFGSKKQVRAEAALPEGLKLIVIKDIETNEFFAQLEPVGNKIYSLIDDQKGYKKIEEENPLIGTGASQDPQYSHYLKTLIQLINEYEQENAKNFEENPDNRLAFPKIKIEFSKNAKVQKPDENPVDHDQEQEIDLERDPEQETKPNTSDNSVKQEEKTIHYPENNELGLQHDFNCSIGKAFYFGENPNIISAQAIVNKDTPKVVLIANQETVSITLFKDIKTQKFYANARGLSDAFFYHKRQAEGIPFFCADSTREINPQNPQVGRGHHSPDPVYTPYLKSMIYAINTYEKEIETAKDFTTVKFRKNTDTDLEKQKRNNLQYLEQQKERDNFIEDNISKPEYNYDNIVKIKILESKNIVANKPFLMS